MVVVKAYQYTSLTSVMLLDCWAIPCVMLLTWVFLRTQYGIKKFIGVAICVAGVVLDVFSDVHAEDRASNKYLSSFNLIAVNKCSKKKIWIKNTYTQAVLLGIFSFKQNKIYPGNY